jgi:hypothetical protein
MFALLEIILIQIHAAITSPAWNLDRLVHKMIRACGATKYVVRRIDFILRRNDMYHAAQHNILYGGFI